MKKILYLSIAFYFFTTISSFSFLASNSTIQVWADLIFIEGSPFCFGYGDRCLIIIQKEPFRIPGVIEDINPFGRHLSLQYSNISEYNIPNPGLGNPYYTPNVNHINYTFKVGEKVRIEECPEDESLEGLEFEIGGMSTDSQGKLHLFIPW